MNIQQAVNCATGESASERLVRNRGDLQRSQSATAVVARRRTPRPVRAHTEGHDRPIGSGFRRCERRTALSFVPRVERPFSSNEGASQGRLGPRSNVTVCLRSLPDDAARQAPCGEPKAVEGGVTRAAAHPRSETSRSYRFPGDLVGTRTSDLWVMRACQASTISDANRQGASRGANRFGWSGPL